MTLVNPFASPCSHWLTQTLRARRYPSSTAGRMRWAASSRTIRFMRHLRRFDSRACEMVAPVMRRGEWTVVRDRAGEAAHSWLLAHLISPGA